MAETQLARAGSQPSRQQGNAQADAYYQMQVLQQEVLELRGAVEELRHEVKRLKQQRTDDYMDLDRRISRLSGEAPSGAPANGGDAEGADANNGGTGSAAPSTGSAAPAASADERERYQASFGLARNGDYDGASKEFKRLLNDFPNGQYAPNANYWLGEIALVQGNLEEARQWFVALLDGYPNSTKVWDGRYKLGTVYHQLGEDSRARDLLQQVAASDARASGLAKKYLEENF
ncbi:MULTISPECIES: YbgF trimerization domain-containing protein [Microbulbifer]|nr:MULTISPECIES: YbgF trimerization domain-containing protein [Microbulbifer]